MNTATRFIPALTKASRQIGGVRSMGSHGGPPPTGIEAKVRAVLPQDYQIVLATLGIYTTIGLLFKLKPSKKPVEAESVASSSTSTAIPSILDESFDEWSKIPGNMAKWEASLDNLETFGN